MSGTEVRRRQKQVGVRLTSDESERLTAEAQRLGVTGAEVLRQAIPPKDREAEAREWRLRAAKATPRRYPAA